MMVTSDMMSKDIATEVYVAGKVKGNLCWMLSTVVGFRDCFIFSEEIQTSL